MITGYIKVAQEFKPTQFWAALVIEPSTVVQTGVGMTLATSVRDNLAVVAVDAANVRSSPSIASSVIDQVKYGTELQIIGQSLRSPGAGPLANWRNKRAQLSAGMAAGPALRSSSDRVPPCLLVTQRRTRGCVRVQPAAAGADSWRPGAPARSQRGRSTRPAPHRDAR